MIIKNITALLFLFFSTVTLAQQTPEDFTISTINQSLKILKDFQASGGSDISSTIKNNFIKHVDVNKSTKFVFGKSWNKMTNSQKNGAKKYLVNKLINDYSSLILSYKQENEVIIDIIKKKTKGNLAIISTKISTKESSPTKVSFKLINNSPWMVYDVVVLGTSLMNTYKYMIKSKIRRKGLEAVIASF